MKRAYDLKQNKAWEILNVNLEFSEFSSFCYEPLWGSAQEKFFCFFYKLKETSFNFSVTMETMSSLFFLQPLFCFSFGN